MRNILIILLLFSPPCQAQIPKDKILHLGAGTLAGGYGYICSPKQDGWMPVVFAVSMSTLAGVAKETYDKKYGQTGFDKKDLTCTIIGGVVSGFGIMGLKAIIHKRKYKRYVLQNNYIRNK